MVTAAKAGRHWPLSLLFAIFCGIWMIATDTLGWLVLNWNEAAYIIFWVLATPVYVISFVVSVVHLFRARQDGGRAAVMPLMVNILSFVLAVWPLDPSLERIEFAMHHADRTEVVQRIEAGEFWNGSPLTSAAYLPSEYSLSVSGNSRWHRVTAYYDEGSLHVVFYPATGNLLIDVPALLYRADGNPPSFPNKHVPDASLSEALGNGWYRISRPAFLPFVLGRAWDRFVTCFD
jgi:hypothetical protein